MGLILKKKVYLKLSEKKLIKMRLGKLKDNFQNDLFEIFSAHRFTLGIGWKPKFVCGYKDHHKISQRKVLTKKIK